MLRFALDEDFPETILNGLGIGIPEAELTPIRSINKRLLGMDDWQLLLSLHHLGEWDGLLTTDARMLKLPRELSVIHQTKLTVVVVEESGHDPVRAAGLLLVHLPMICRKTVRTEPQIWKLSARDRNHERPFDELARLAAHRGSNARKLFHEHRLTKAELTSNPLSMLPLG